MFYFAVEKRIDFRELMRPLFQCGNAVLNGSGPHLILCTG